MLNNILINRAFLLPVACQMALKTDILYIFVHIYEAVKKDLPFCIQLVCICCFPAFNVPVIPFCSDRFVFW